LSNWKFKGADAFFTILIFGAFIPYQVMLYPIVIMLREVGLYGSLGGLVLVHTVFGMPILTLLFRNYFTSLPRGAVQSRAGGWCPVLGDLRESYGPNVPADFYRRCNFTGDRYLERLLVWCRFTPAPDNYPMTVSLNNIVNSTQGVKEYNVNMAATILTGLVPLSIYFVSGRLFVRGIAAGAVRAENHAKLC
jgi:glucose/mannose transport system permease protein